MNAGCTVTDTVEHKTHDMTEKSSSESTKPVICAEVASGFIVLFTELHVPSLMSSVLVGCKVVAPTALPGRPWVEFLNEKRN